MNLRERIDENINNIVNNKPKDEIIIKLLQELLSLTIIHLEIAFQKKPVIKERKITIDNISNEKYNVSFGINRTNDTIKFGKFLFNYAQKTQTNLLIFLVIKESIVHFIEKQLTEIDEIIIYIITLLKIRELFEMSSYEVPFIASIHRFFPQEISSYSNFYYINLMQLLYTRKINSVEIFNLYIKWIDEKLPDSKIPDSLKTWVAEKTITINDNIAPIFLNKKQVQIIECLLEQGEENGSSSNVAKTLNMTRSPVRLQFMHLNETYSTYWRAEINYEKLGLFNYFFKIVVSNEQNFNIILNKLVSEKYLRSIFTGKINNSLVLYSPALICPFIVGENLGAYFEKLSRDNLIEDYTLQLVRGRQYFTTITTHPIKSPTLKTFSSFLENEKNNLRKYVFSTEEKKYSHEDLYDLTHIDDNLLFFLSIIRGKSLQKARYHMLVSELPLLYEKNKIKISDVDAQTYFLNQIEIRAKRRNLLNYKLYMRNFATRGVDVCIIEIPTINQSFDELQKLISKLRIFSYLTQMNLFDRIILALPSITHEHPVVQLIKRVILQSPFEASYYTIRLNKSNFVPYHDLYDFESKKWII
ncbi:MAG: hypothetical protein ACFFDW_07230 [Candidatus Thorarchaeota archaeon]